MNIQAPKLIFSVYQNTQTEDVNEENHLLLQDQLQRLGVPFTEVSGTYEGQPERGVVVLANQRPLVEAYMYEFNQECYLEIDANGQGYLIDGNERVTPIGQARTSEDKPEGDYSKIGNTYLEFK